MSKRKSWDQLFDGRRTGLTAFLRRRARTADASDLTQEVYLRFLRADQADVIRNPEAYLYTVAVNLLREQSVLARRWGHVIDADEIPDDPALVSLRTPEEEVDAETRMACLSQLIESLPPKPRAALILQYRDGLSYDEIASALGVTPHAVKKYVMQGLATCRKRLRRAGDPT